jgi:hypothetical protein
MINNNILYSPDIGQYSIISGNIKPYRQDFKTLEAVVKYLPKYKTYPRKLFCGNICWIFKNEEDVLKFLEYMDD